MENENVINEQVENSNDNTQYTDDNIKQLIETINDLRNNSVPKEKYEKSVKENKMLLDAVVKNQPMKAEVLQKPTAQEYRNKLFGLKGSMSNLEYCKTALDLRDAVIAEGGDDPFVGSGHKLTPSRDDYESAQRVADVMRDVLNMRMEILKFLQMSSNAELLTLKFHIKNN